MPTFMAVATTVIAKGPMRHSFCRRAAATITAACAAVIVTSTAAPGPASAVPTTAARTATVAVSAQRGVYTNPGSKNLAGARAFVAFSGAPLGRLLDFLPTTTWLEMTRNAWLLTAYTGAGYQLELSVPMLPNEAGVSLAACASGSYDTYWRSIAGSVVTAGLPGTEIRPGWEMNGTWYGG